VSTVKPLKEALKRVYTLPAISGVLVDEYVDGRHENVVAETNGKEWDFPDPSLNTIIAD